MYLYKIIRTGTTNVLPVLLMIGLIPIIVDDYALTLYYTIIILISLKVFRWSKKDIYVLCIGFFIMTCFEYVFIKTGVEVFTRRSLFNMMPLWLPFLWAYGFVSIKHTLELFK